MALLQINSAIPLAEPLLEQHREEELAVKRGRPTEHLSHADTRTRTKFIVLGTLTGFFIQVISLGAYAFLLLQSTQDMDTESLATTVLTGDGFFQLPKPTQDGTDESGYWFGSDTFVYATLSVLTQIDLIVYILIWVAFTCTMTRNGMACIRSQFFRGHEEKNAVVHRRYVFVLGVCFLVGIVLGAFVAWSTVDMYLGYPIPMKPIVLTVGIDLVLCYMMVCCFDMGGRQRQVFGCGSSDEQEIEFDDKTISEEDYYDSDEEQA